jgi:hypothetical protein
MHTKSQDEYRKLTCKKISLFIHRKRWSCPILHIYTKRPNPPDNLYTVSAPSPGIMRLPNSSFLKRHIMSEQSPQETRRFCSKLSMIGNITKQPAKGIVRSEHLPIPIQFYTPNHSKLKTKSKPKHRFYAAIYRSKTNPFPHNRAEPKPL